MSRVLDGNGRVRAERWIDDGGRSLAAPRSFFDTELDEPCYPSVFAEGIRCVTSSAAQWSHTFSDAGCNDPVVPWSGEKPPFVYATHYAANECDNIEFEAAYQTGSTVTQGTYFVQQETSCTSVPLPMGTTLYKLGGEVDVPRLAP